jgi:hypothetical protein
VIVTTVEISTGKCTWKHEQTGDILKEETYDKLTSGKWHFSIQMGNYSGIEAELLTETISKGSKTGKSTSKTIKVK